MKLKLLEWASIAEIVSGLAVLITLVFLIAGVRENTAALRGSAYADFLEDLNQLQTSLMGDPKLASLWDAYISEETSGLDGSDRAQLRLAALTHLRIYEAAFFQREYGLFGDREWERFKDVGCPTFHHIGSFQEDLLTEAFSTTFVTYMKANCPE